MSADAAAEEALALRDRVVAAGWVAPGLAGGAGLAALDAPIRPIDRLAAAGLGWLVPHVRPLQEAVDGMAGDAAAVGSFAEAWLRAADRVDAVRRDLVRSAPAETAAWRGEAAERHRASAVEIAEALRGAAAVAEATGAAARTMGEAAALARTAAGELLDDLVRRLVATTRRAVAAEGGITPAVVADAAEVVDLYRAPIAEQEEKLRRTVRDVEPLLAVADDDHLAALGAPAEGGAAPRPHRPHRAEPRRRLGPAQTWERREIGLD